MLRALLTNSKWKTREDTNRSVVENECMTLRILPEKTLLSGSTEGLGERKADGA